MRTNKYNSFISEALPFIRLCQYAQLLPYNEDGRAKILCTFRPKSIRIKLDFRASCTEQSPYS